MTRGKAEQARLTCDVVVLTRRGEKWEVLVIDRRYAPHEGCSAFPGGHVDRGETVEDAARRELREETGLVAPRLDLVGVYSTPGRDPRGRYVTWAWLATVDGDVTPVAGDDARAAYWVPVGDLLADPARLAFDHHQILLDALAAAGQSIP